MGRAIPQYTLTIPDRLALVLLLGEPTISLHLNLIPSLKIEPLVGGVNKNYRTVPNYTLSWQNERTKTLESLILNCFKLSFSFFSSVGMLGGVGGMGFIVLVSFPGKLGSGVISGSVSFSQSGFSSSFVRGSGGGVVEMVSISLFKTGGGNGGGTSVFLRS